MHWNNQWKASFHGACLVLEVINNVYCSLLCPIKLLKDLTFATEIMNCVTWESEFDGSITFVNLEPYFKVSVFGGDYGGHGWHFLLVRFSRQLNLKEPAMDVLENSFCHTDVLTTHSKCKHRLSVQGFSCLHHSRPFCLWRVDTSWSPKRY